MPFAELDCAAVARTLSQLAERPGDMADAYFERLEEVELPGGDHLPGVRVRREQGFALRLIRGGATWMASRDEITPGAFADALKRVARALPVAAYPEPRLAVAPWAEAAEIPELAALPAAVNRAVRAHHVAFPLHLTVRRHRRWLQVVAGPLVPAPEQESFYSCAADLPWGRYGALLPELTDDAAQTVADGLVELFRCRHAAPPEPFRGVVVLAPAAASVLLHEAVAHSLEADTLAAGGDPEAALGVRLGPPSLSVLDDPSAAPASVRRRSDDEGREVRRRWLVQDGEVRQPLADAHWAQASEALLPGAARRGGRHDLPGPRSTHLELVPGEHDEAALTADAEGGLWVPEAASGDLDPLTGGFRLSLPSARRIRGGVAADPVGPCRLVGRVTEVLAGVAGIAGEARPAGAGWCAKGGQKLPVWATCPALRLEGVEVEPWR